MSSKKRNITKPQIEFVVTMQNLHGVLNSLGLDSYYNNSNPSPRFNELSLKNTEINNKSWMTFESSFVDLFDSTILPYKSFVLRVADPEYFNTTILKFDGSKIQILGELNTHVIDTQEMATVTIKDGLVQFLNSNRLYSGVDAVNFYMSLLLDVLPILGHIANSNISYTMRHTSRVRNGSKGRVHTPLIQNTIIAVKESYVRPKPISTGEGTPKSPHLRRSHIRTLKNGKTCVVKSCKIKGGTDEVNYSISSN